MSAGQPAVPSEVAAELLRAETALLDPAVRRNRAEVAALLAEDFFEIGSSGRVWTRDQILDLLAHENHSPAAIEDFACHPLAGQVILVTYRTVRANPAAGQAASVLRSSLWTHQSGHWRMRFHQGTPAR